jgi:hypothetical protein
VLPFLLKKFCFEKRVLIDRLNLKENKDASDIFQPAIEMEKIDSEKNTWLGYSRK